MPIQSDAEVHIAIGTIQAIQLGDEVITPNHETGVFASSKPDSILARALRRLKPPFAHTQSVPEGVRKPSMQLEVLFFNGDYTEHLLVTYCGPHMILRGGEITPAQEISPTPSPATAVEELAF